MTHLLGIDIGTSSVKTAVIEAETARVVSSSAREYPISQPHPGYAEQDPDDWWGATVHTVHRAVETAGIDPASVRGIGFSGQMHGTVCIDDGGRPLRPAIIWADARSEPQLADLKSRLDVAEMARHAPGPPAAGFMALTLMWLAEHEPETLAGAQSIILPKDYVRLRMTGEAGTEVTDASATWLLDVAAGEWSNWLLERCGLERRYMPPIAQPTDVIGGLRPDAADALGLPPGVPVVAGCADQPAQALGYGLIDPGRDLVTIGTGGQVFHPLAAPHTDPLMRLHVFTHAAPGRWYAQAAILAAGLSLRWLRDLLGLTERADAYEHLSALAAEVPPGAEGLVFLPYLAGERSPHMDPQASGVFVGLRLHHGAGHLARAVMEGVAFALAGCLSLIKDLGGGGDLSIIASGGAAESPVWRQIQADVYDAPLMLSASSHYACVGAGLLAGVGGGVYDSLADACARLPRPTVQTTPGAAASFYRQRRDLFDNLYAHLQADMHRLSAERQP